MIAQVKPKKKPRTGEATGPQTIHYNWGDGVLYKDLVKLAPPKDYRELRKDPTIASGRGLLVCGVMQGSWSVEHDNDIEDEVVRSIEALLPFRDKIMRPAVALGRVDYGWMGFEKIFKVEGGQFVLERVKPLLHDMTYVLIDRQGNFRGYRQRSVGYGTLGQPPSTGGPVYPIVLPVEKCLHIAFEVEAGALYGIPLLENIRATQAMWKKCNDGAERYDLKVAGTHWVVHYPPGTGVMDGETVDNGTIASKLLEALQASGSLAVPTTVAEYLQEITNESVADLYAWKIELLSDAKARQKTFVDRLKYLDSLKTRGLLIPERAMLEGTHGTKSEAETHIGLMITHMEDLDRTITCTVNENIVDQLLRVNYGDEMVGKVRLVAAPLVDLQIEFLRKMYLQVLSDPTALVSEISRMDLGALKEQLNVPVQAIETIE